MERFEDYDYQCRNEIKSVTVMIRLSRILVYAFVFCAVMSMSAQNYKSERLKRAADVLGLQISADSILPDTMLMEKARDGRTVYFRTDPMGTVEQIGIPLFSDLMRILQPSPVYDFLDFAVLNWKYKVTQNQLYLSKVIFKKGSWDTLLNGKLDECQCMIENREDKLYIVNWQRDGKDVATIGIPIEYELLNNDTRRNMERDFLKELEAFSPNIKRKPAPFVREDELSIYGTEGLFVLPGKSYIIDLLNQNVYYKLTTITEAIDTIINNKPVTMNLEAVLPVVVIDPEFPAETFANFLMCGDESVPEVTIELDFHLSNYHRRKLEMPLSRLKAFCSQQGCGLYFACDIVKDGKIRGVLFASNLPKGYNHLFSLRTTTDQFAESSPKVSADVYLYIPPIDKEKLFGIAPKKKSGAKFRL